MLNTILSALLPMVVTFLLGFVAAWHHDFGPTDAQILNRMVLRYAVPLVLFVGTVSTPRAQLSHDITLFIALCIASSACTAWYFCYPVSFFTSGWAPVH